MQIEDILSALDLTEQFIDYMEDREPSVSPSPCGQISHKHSQQEGCVDYKHAAKHHAQARNTWW